MAKMLYILGHHKVVDCFGTPSEETEAVLGAMLQNHFISIQNIAQLNIRKSRPQITLHHVGNVMEINKVLQQRNTILYDDRGWYVPFVPANDYCRLDAAVWSLFLTEGAVIFSKSQVDRVACWLAKPTKSENIGAFLDKTERKYSDRTNQELEQLSSKDRLVELIRRNFRAPSVKRIYDSSKIVRRLLLKKTSNPEFYFDLCLYFNKTLDDQLKNQCVQNFNRYFLLRKDSILHILDKRVESGALRMDQPWRECARRFTPNYS